MIALINGSIFTGETIVSGKAVLIQNGLIADIVTEDKLPETCERLDLSNQLLVPGFVDVQVNGGGGVLVDGNISVEDLATIARTHRQSGTTTLMPTLITDDLDAMRATRDTVHQALEQQVPGISGIHFEGPLLSKTRNGIHNEQKIRAVDNDLMALYQADLPGVRMVTLAPETVPGGTIAALTKSGIRVCAGHTAGSWKDIQSALDEGLAGFTHLYNAMTTMESRAPGVVGAALDDDNTWCGLIVDGHHIHPATLRNAIRAKATGKMMLVSDAMPSVGSDLTCFDLYGRTITVAEDRCVAEDGTLAGCHLDMATAVRNCTDLVGLPLMEALRMASMYPAEFLGLGNSLGRIEPGYRADLALLTDGLRVSRTWIEGKE